MRIISNHIPKAGGLTFRHHLEAIYKERVFHDYTPCGHPNYKATPPPPYLVGQLRNHKKTTVIHGHFLFERYSQIPVSHFVCWFRDPIERLLSHYYYWLRAPDYNHPYCLELVEKGLSVVDFAKLIPNLYTRRLSPLDINNLSFVGIFEDYNESLRLFYAMFCPDRQLKFDLYKNKNFARDTEKYRLDKKQRKELEKINKSDIELYKKALDRFHNLQDKGGF